MGILYFSIVIIHIHSLKEITKIVDAHYFERARLLNSYFSLIYIKKERGGGGGGGLCKMLKEFLNLKYGGIGFLIFICVMFSR